MKTYLKTLWRMFTRHKSRFVSVILIVLVSVGFISGIGTVTEEIDHSLAEFYRTHWVSDLIVKCTGNGFTDEDAEAISNLLPDARIDRGNSFDVNLTIGGERQLVRLCFLEGERTVNLPEILDAPQIAPEHPVYAEEKDNRIRGIPSGTEITLDFADILSQLAEQGGTEQDELTKSMLSRLDPVNVTVCGHILSPLTFALDGEPSYIQEGDDFEVPDIIAEVGNLNTLDNILYLPADLIPRLSDILPILPDDPVLQTSDLWIALGDREMFMPFGPRYDARIAELETKIKETLSGDSGSYAEVLTLYQNFSFKSLHAYAGKVEAIGWVLMAAFLFVTVLVVLSTMTRLMEEERAQVGCLSTLGYSPFRIVFKYLLFALLATGVGGFVGYFVGLGLSDLLYYVFNYSFVMPPMSGYVAVGFYFIIFALIVVATVAATAYAGGKMSREHPADLLRPHPPRAGKKVILERIPILWNRLSFKYKSTVRNVLRYMNRFIMTVVAVACSTALVMAGLGLLDLCLFGTLNSPSIVAVAFVVILFAGLLTVAVIYTLTNINVSERARELATLMVLGYYNGEVSGYIYREIFIDTAIGILCGYPLSALLVGLVFKAIGIGTLGGISWYMWFVAPVVIMLFTGLVALLLRHKIVKIDMNESLKAIE